MIPTSRHVEMCTCSFICLVCVVVVISVQSIPTSFHEGNLFGLEIARIQLYKKSEEIALVFIITV